MRADPHEKLAAIEAIVPPTLGRGSFKAPDQLLAMVQTKALPPRPSRGGYRKDQRGGVFGGTERVNGPGRLGSRR